MAYSGLYRAKVVQHGDERQKGRIKVTIPDISGGKGKSQWVDLCMNCAYEEGGDIAVPKLGDTCWIAFERGDINLPVYMGNFFGAFKTPLPDYDEDTRVISWDSCRIEMKGETMKFIVGEKSLITITTDSISLQVGENSEGVLDTGGAEGSNTEEGAEGETSNPPEEQQPTPPSGEENGRSLIVMTQGNIIADTTIAINMSAKENITADSTAITMSAKTMACMRATAEVSLMGKHIGLNDGAATSAMKVTSLSDALSKSSFASSFGNLGIGDALNSSAFSSLTNGMMENIKSFGGNAFSSILSSTGVTDVLGNSTFVSALDGVGKLNSILSPDTLSNLASDAGLLGAVGGLDNLNSVLDTSKFSDLIDLPDVSDALRRCGDFGGILSTEVTDTLKDDSSLQEGLGLQVFKDMPFNEAIGIEGFTDILDAENSVLTDVLSDKGISRASQNDDFVVEIMEERYQEKTAGDEAFEEFSAEDEISRLSDETFLVNNNDSGGEEDEETEEE